MDELEKLITRLMSLKQNKGKTREDIEPQAKEILERKEILGSLSFCLEEEKKFAANLLEKYLAESAIESFTDKDTLRQLIDLEIVVERIKKLLNIEYEKANKAIPEDMLKHLISFNSQIIEMKESLGLTQRKDEKNDTVKTIENLLERFHKHINKPENRSNYEFQCPNCLEMFLIRRRLDKEKDEVVGHPWFIEGGVLFNKAIFEDLEAGKISEDQVIRYLNATSDYIKWIKQNYPLNEDKMEEDNEE